MHSKGIVSFKFTRVSRRRDVMVAANEFSSNKKILGNVAFIVIEKDRFAVNMVNGPVR
jgi:hypothetical protein